MFKFITACFVLLFSSLAVAGQYTTVKDEFTSEVNVYFESTKIEAKMGDTSILVSKTDEGSARVLFDPYGVVNCDITPISAKLTDGTFIDYPAKVFQNRYCYFEMPIEHMKGVVKFKVPMYNARSRITQIDFRGFDINKLK